LAEFGVVLVVSVMVTVRLAILVVFLIPVSAMAQQRTDFYGDPLPDGAVARLGTVKFRLPRVESVGFRSTGELVAFTEKLELHVWPADGSPKATVTSLSDGKTYGSYLALAPNARFAAAAMSRGIVVWDLSGNQPREYLVRESRWAYRLCFSADARWLAVNETQPTGKILLCDLAAKKWSEIPYKDQYAEAFSFSPDGKSLLVGRYSVSVIDTVTGKERFKPNMPPMNVRSAALSPDGTTLAVLPVTFIHGPEPMVRLVSTETGAVTKALNLPASTAYWINFTSDGKSLLFGDRHGIREWDPVTGKLVREIAGPAETTLVYSADRRRLASHSRSAVLLADVASGRALHPELIDAGHTALVWDVTISPDGKRIATISLDGDVRIWAADNGRQQCRVRTNSMGNHHVAFLPDSKSFITVAEDWVTPVVHDTDSGRELRRFTFPEELAKKVTTHDLRLSANGKTLTTSAGPNRVGDKAYTIRWDVATGMPIERLESKIDLRMFDVGGVGDSPDGRWHVEYGRLNRIGGSGSIPLIPPGESAGFTPPVFSDDSRLVAVMQTPRSERNIDWTRSRVVVFEVASLAKVAEIPTGRITGQVFSHDGRLLAVVGPEEVGVWDLASGRVIRRFRGEGLNLQKQAVAFMPDDRHVISGHDDGTAIIWDISRRNIAKQLTAADSLAAWADLAQPDGAKGFAAVCRLADDPTQALVFLKDRLRPAAVLPADEVQKLVSELGSANFQTREDAEKALRAFGDRVEAPLREALKFSTSAEAKRRIEAILAAFASLTPPDGETLRGIRAVWVLERIGTQDARQLLSELAKGAETDRLTRESKTALERLGQ
jgi:WD40 repeat protein